MSEIKPAWFMPETMVRVPVAELVPYAGNARTHSAAQVEKIRASIREFGFVSPVLIDGDRNIIAGHGRVLAAKAEGMADVPCVLVEHLSEKQRRAYILADNRLAELGAWDMEILRGELDALAEMGADMSLAGFEAMPLPEMPVCSIGADAFGTEAAAGGAGAVLAALGKADASASAAEIRQAAATAGVTAAEIGQRFAEIGAALTGSTADGGAGAGVKSLYDKLSAAEGGTMLETAKAVAEWIDENSAAIEQERAALFFDGKADNEDTEDNAEYTAFVDKFKAKKTTDDCYTPENVYDAVADWAAAEYQLNRAAFVRPFYPGGDYQKFEYPAGCVVVDNPPFSILNEIVRWYMERGIRFFLFAPYLTVMGAASIGGVCVIASCYTVQFENGAEVALSFLTNMDEAIARSVPQLTDAIEAADKENRAEKVKKLPKFDYPPEVLTGTRLGMLSKYGVDFRVKPEDACFIRELDSQKENGKSIFGGGLLLSEKAAAEKAAAEKAAAEKAAAITWQLSDREREIVRQLGKGGDG